MKASIINGILELYPQSNTEDYALGKWYKDNVHQCTRVVNGEYISFNSMNHPMAKWYNRLKFKIKLFLLR